MRLLPNSPHCQPSRDIHHVHKRRAVGMMDLDWYRGRLGGTACAPLLLWDVECRNVRIMGAANHIAEEPSG
jgi:hypothetical protein